MNEDAARTEQREALAELGFSTPIHMGGLFGPEAVYCLGCGATVMLLPVSDYDPPPLALHHRSHNPDPPPTEEPPDGDTDC